MKYTVLWQRKAEQSLADIWLRSHQREAVTQAAQEIDSELGSRALDVGESRSGNERIIFHGCLGVAYSVSSDDAIARVLRVWEIKQRSG
jgi:hypothetical protein